MASRFIFAFFILNNTFFIQKIHKADLIIFSMEIAYKWRTCKNFETILNTIGIAQTCIAYQPDIDLLFHITPSISIQQTDILEQNFCVFSPHFDFRMSIYNLLESLQHVLYT